MSLPHDPLWPRASAWLESASRHPRVVVMGVPAHQTSLSPTHAYATPSAIRSAIARYSTYSIEHHVDVADIPVFDAGDVAFPDFEDGEQRVLEKVQSLPEHDLLVAVGGDNSITFSVMSAAFDAALGQAGLITLDAHFDLRDGISNGSPVRRLIEAGLSGRRVVQIGIADFANSAEYAARARDYGITVITRGALRSRPIEDAMAEALEIAGNDTDGVYVDLDVDVCDRAVVPACPAATPGGISPDELRRAAFSAARDPRVRAIDITEIDATADTPDQRTIRLAALLLLEATAGLACRPT